ncbi:MAG: DUF4347 domain-containing protein [Cyanobacteria bacterium P01_F01_bin.53]
MNTNPLDAVQAGTSPQSIAFVDSGLAQAYSLQQGIEADYVVRLNDNTSGIEQISQVLRKYQNLDSIHIFSHGSSGALQLGNTILNQAVLAEYQDDLEHWGNSLLHEGDLLFYGCDLAATEEGIAFVEQVSQLTQADVAASNDVTGHASLGGDWELEVTTGDIAEVLAVESYQGILPTYNGNTYQLTSGGAKTWKAAQAEAEALGGNLVTINNGAEEAWLKQTFGTEGLWIGINDIAAEGQFQWASGEAVTYTNWAPGEPNNGGGSQDYGWMNYGGSNQWDDHFAGAQLRGIVEIEGNNPPPTTDDNAYRYIRFVANSEVNGNPWTSVAELNVLDTSGNAISQANWSLVSVNSQETAAEFAPATQAFDGNANTFWHTEWAPPGEANDPAHNHEIVIDLGATYELSGFSYLARQNGSNGRVADYQFFAADDTTNWGTALSSGTFSHVATAQTAQFTTDPGNPPPAPDDDEYRYIRFVANSEVNNNPWTSVAELNVLDTNGNDISQANWSLVSVNSEELVASNNPGTAAFDGNANTFWHTEWAAPGEANDPAHNHEIVIDLGASYGISGFSYLSRQDGSQNGRVASYQFFAGDTASNWGGAIATGTFDNKATEQTVVFSDSPTPPSPTNGLVGHWQFNELTPAAQVVDASGNGNTGTNININPGNTSYSGPINSAPIFNTFNPRSGNFDGVNDYVSIGSSPELDFSNGQFTQSVWIRPTADDNGYHGILGYQNGAGSNNRAPGLWTVGQTKIHAGFGDGTNWNNFTTDDVLRVNEWNHVVSSFDGTTYKIHVDGQEVYTTNAFAGRRPSAVQQLDIGRVDNYFKGQIDEVRLYDRSLSLSEVQQLYVAQPTQAKVGDWSKPVEFPNIPVAAAVLPNGKVVTWSSWDRFTFGGNSPQQSYTSIWDPATGEVSEVLVTNTAHDMFCPGIAMLPDGRLLVNGGGEYVTSTSIFDFETGQWSDGPDMEYRRWYNSSLTLADGDVFTIGGERSNTGNGARITTGLGEVFDLTDGWRTLSGAPIAPIANTGDRGTEHPQIFLAPNGKVFAAGPSPTMYWYDTNGNGSITVAGERGDSPYSQVGMSVMYDTGKILFAGGSLVYDRAGASGYNTAYTIDINNENAISVDKQDPMSYKRVYGTGVVLPNGQVLAMGGQQDSKAFTDNQAVYRPELWDPQTGKWTLMDNHDIPRTYHSVSLLLPDGRVMAGGGGLAGAGNPVNHPDAEIFTPPYLYNADGTLADRPVIGSGPDSVGYNQNFSITMNTGAPITEFNLVRMSAVTHGVNTDQRFLSVDVMAKSGNTYTLNTPENGNIAPPGYYMLFALDGNGVPSEAKIIQIT